ncbi:hypothetical protein BST32_01750 [Mycobacteroides abscessus subsp. massiliense]|nr:hypothetical protein BST32_01750 [Mycobacteroides abscessus subsp. massiliense]WJJ56386.1 hypothetical protein PROPHICCUG48898T2_54 [Mycobacterium phage CCUG48898T-2]
MRTMRRRLSDWLHHMAVKVHDDYHHWELKTEDGARVSFGCYWQYALSWTEEFMESCSCYREDLR